MPAGQRAAKGSYPNRIKAGKTSTSRVPKKGGAKNRKVPMKTNLPTGWKG